YLLDRVCHNDDAAIVRAALVYLLVLGSCRVLRADARVLPLGRRELRRCFIEARRRLPALRRPPLRPNLMSSGSVIGRPSPRVRCASCPSEPGSEVPRPSRQRRLAASHSMPERCHRGRPPTARSAPPLGAPASACRRDP